MSKSKRTDAIKLRIEGYTYAEIGTRLGISRQRAQQLTSPPRAVRDFVVQKADGRCLDCGFHTGTSGHVHHLSNGLEYSYNDLENLQLLCPSCHRIAHSNDLRSQTSVMQESPPDLACKRCGHTWTTRIDHKPVRCPRCSSTTWDKRRTK